MFWEYCLVSSGEGCYGQVSVKKLFFFNFKDTVWILSDPLSAAEPGHYTVSHVAVFTT